MIPISIESIPNTDKLIHKNLSTETTMKTKLSSVLCVMLMSYLLSGCLSQEQILQQQSSKCQSFGFRPGSQQFSQCMMQLVRDSNKENECSRLWMGVYSSQSSGRETGEASRAYSDCMAGRPISRPAPTPVQSNPSTTTICNQVGNSIVCNSR